MKPISILSLVLFIGLHISCTPSPKETFNDIDISEFEEVDSFKFGDKRFFKNSFLVKLETGDASLIGEIRQVEITKDRIYILDNKSRILVFDFNGTYLYDIGRRGNGPGEYQHISAFYVENDFVNVFDPMNMAVFQYTTTGEYNNKTAHKNNNLGFIRKIIPINQQQLLAYSATNWEDNAMFSLIDKSSYETIKNIWCYPGKSEDYISYFSSRQPFTRFNGKTTFGVLFSDILYNYDSENQQVSPGIRLKTGLNYISDELLKRKLENHGYNYSTVIREVTKENKYNSGIINIFENERYLLSDFKSGICMNATLFDKQENKGWLTNQYCHCYPDFGSFITTFENTVVRVWSNNEMFYFKKELEEHPEKKKNYPKEVLEMVNQQNLDEDNPILIFFEFN